MEKSCDCVQKETVRKTTFEFKLRTVNMSHSDEEQGTFFPMRKLTEYRPSNISEVSESSQNGTKRALSEMLSEIDVSIMTNLCSTK